MALFVGGTVESGQRAAAGLRLAPGWHRRSALSAAACLSYPFMCYATMQRWPQGQAPSPRRPLHKHSEAEAARLHAKARLHHGSVMAGRPARQPFRRLWLAAQGRLCCRGRSRVVPALLASTTADLAGRLRGIATHDRTSDGRPEVHSDIPGHFCRHRWRLPRGRTATHTLSTKRRVDGQAIPYMQAESSVHLAGCIPRFFGTPTSLQVSTPPQAVRRSWVHVHSEGGRGSAGW